jgi:uncharacterized protein
MAESKDKLQAALKEAMLGKDNFRRDVIRLLQSAVKQVEIDGRKDLSEAEVQAILQKEAKRRRESIDEARKIGREDIVSKESDELTVIEGFLPKQLSRDEVVALAKAAIASVGASGGKDMSKVMAQLMPQVKGLADGGMVNQVVKELLG